MSLPCYAAHLSHTLLLHHPACNSGTSSPQNLRRQETLRVCVHKHNGPTYKCRRYHAPHTGATASCLQMEGFGTLTAIQINSLPLVSVTGSHFNPPNTSKQQAPVHGPDQVRTASVPSATHPLHGALQSSHPIKWDDPHFTVEETGWEQLPDLPQTSPLVSARARIQTWVYHVWIVGDDWYKTILDRKVCSPWGTLPS